jgi:hypothetical protein
MRPASLVRGQLHNHLERVQVNWLGFGMVFCSYYLFSSIRFKNMGR